MEGLATPSVRHLQPRVMGREKGHEAAPVRVDIDAAVLLRLANRALPCTQARLASALASLDL